jgi:hypothetical protein
LHNALTQVTVPGLNACPAPTGRDSALKSKHNLAIGGTIRGGFGPLPASQERRISGASRRAVTHE